MKKQKNKKNSIHFGKKEVTVSGIWSCGIFILEVLLFFLCLGIACVLEGNAGIGVGLGGFAIIVLGILGLIFGIEGKKQKGNYFHYIDEIGIGANVIVLIAMGILFFMGTRLM